jgi:glucose dehydrogenase
MIDPVRKVVYVSTGNQYTEPQLTTSDSVVAIDLESGKIKWSSQRLEKDVGSSAVHQRVPLPLHSNVVRCRPRLTTSATRRSRRSS